MSVVPSVDALSMKTCSYWYLPRPSNTALTRSYRASTLSASLKQGVRTEMVWMSDIVERDQIVRAAQGANLIGNLLLEHPRADQHRLRPRRECGRRENRPAAKR